MSELEVVRKFRREVPAAHRSSLDTRLAWLWNQRFGTVQQVWNSSPDLLDHTAATMILQAIMANDLNNMALIFQRLEGGAVDDTVVAEKSEGFRI
jgi:hypothetical protein